MNIRKELAQTKSDIHQTETSLQFLIIQETATRNELNDLTTRIHDLSKSTGINIPIPAPLKEININDINLLLDETIKINETKQRKFPQLSITELVISSIAGIAAIAIDIFLVGTPEVVKIYRGGENFDGSILTKAFRKLGEGPLGDLCKKLETICKVPYDISVVKDGLYPQNHRLRSLSHDPFFGLFFAVFDIMMNTTTFIDNSGCLRIIHNTHYKTPIIEKILCVFYYIGHIISDLFTARGVPVPGFFLSQFFTNGSSDNSIARIAEGMYLDGYDMRHFASMSTPLAVKNIIINLYLKLTEKAEAMLPLTLDKREKNVLEHKLKKEKMNFIANSIAVGGNAVKFFAPPYSCNPCSLNAPEWLAFIKSGIIMLKAQIRDFSAEEAIQNRSEIDCIWQELIVDNNVLSLKPDASDMILLYKFKEGGNLSL